MQQASAQAFAAFLRGKKQHFQRAVLDPHKGGRAARAVLRGHQMSHPLQRLRDIFLDLLDLIAGQKQVGGFYRAFPHVQQLPEQFRCAVMLGDRDKLHTVILLFSAV